jgi:hypothetical protein
MIDELADVAYGSVQRFGRVVFMEGLRKLFPECFEALIAMECNEEQIFFADLNTVNAFVQAQSEISAIRAEVAELRSLITLQSREAAKEEATEVESGSQEDEARSHATEEEFLVCQKVTDGKIQKGDWLKFYLSGWIETARSAIGHDVKSWQEMGWEVYRRKP